MYQEKHFQTQFNKWLKENWSNGNAAFELKICKNNSINFNRVEEHQIYYLLQAKHNKVVWKISDLSLGIKPFDSFVLNKSKAFVVILFYTARQPKVACCIDIDDFLNEQKTCGRKSLTRERAIELSNELIRI